MKYPNCKSTLKNNPKFCPYCGVSLSEKNKEVKPRTKEKGTAIARPYEEIIKYPAETVTLSGFYRADG